MILLCNGDSWTQGDGPAQTPWIGSKKSLDWYNIVPNFGSLCNVIHSKILYKFYESPVWPKVLGEKLDVETWNSGRLGSSNESITHTTINSVEYLKKQGKTDVFVIVGWTSFCRWQTQGIIAKEFKQNCESATMVLGNKEIKIHKLENFNWDALVNVNVQAILQLQDYLKNRNIPYLFFNGFDEYNHKDIIKNSLNDYIDYTNIYHGDFIHTFRKFIEDKYKISWGNDNEYFVTSHPKDISHKIWAKELHEYLKENYYDYFF